MIRWIKGRPYCEVYDPSLGRKRHIKPAEFGMDPAPRGVSKRELERWANRLEAKAVEAFETTTPGANETVASFAERWTRDYPRASDSTNLHNAERIRQFAAEHGHRRMAAVTRNDAVAWANTHKGTVAALRAMFYDAQIPANPFANLGIAKAKGREDITPLTVEEIDQLATIAEQVHGPEFGPEFAAMIRWSAYTCMRPGETFAARYSLLADDVYHLEAQFNSKLGRETQPKHKGIGAIYVPQPAREAVLGKPRRIGDDLMFRTKRGKQFRQGSLHHAWALVRSTFTNQLPAGHHLRTRLAVDPGDHLDFHELRHFGASHMLNVLGIEPWVIAKQLRHTDDGRLVVRLYGHPTREAAIEKMRRAFGGNVAALRDDSAESGRNKLREAK